LGIKGPVVANLVRAYGDRALQVLDLADTEDLTDQIAPGHPQIAAEVAYCARAEMVVHLGDFLSRRTRLSLIDRNAGIGRGGSAIHLMKKELGWTRAVTRSETDAYRSEIERERGLTLGGVSVETSRRRIAGTG
jgi:glycerol-3-phosphate dehydrogenase